jgi:triacylglycerol lipase
MNDPLPNVYDPQNAAALCALAAAAYGADLSDLSDGWDVAGRIVDAGTDTQVMIWKNPRDMVVGFRGTRSLRNFVTDLNCRRVPLLPGKEAEVHEGFQRALDGVYEALQSSVEEMTGGPGAPRLWITGHSLGGALAMLCAWRISNLRSEISNALAGVYTFGEPRVGNAAFRDGYDARLKSRTFRVVDGEDFIPRIPWLLAMYRHCGHEVFYGPAMTNDKCSMANCQSSDTAIENRSSKICHWQLDPPWWAKAFSDVFGTWNEWKRDGRLALLADHNISQYQALFHLKFEISNLKSPA